ncbi:ribbon-helix-helix domain-containing protein [Candidatus Woesearchaeota archaeon]|nr:ribbon-helix-helix domain-containing protein [Candidatus Woesearchaeota archaeon]
MKERITITVDKDLLRWIDKNIETKVFANRSHAVEYLIKQKILGEKK